MTYYHVYQVDKSWVADTAQIWPKDLLSDWAEVVSKTCIEDSSLTLESTLHRWAIDEAVCYFHQHDKQ